LVGAILILGLAGWLLWRNGYVGADTYMADTYMKYFGLEPGFGQNQTDTTTQSGQTVTNQGFDQSMVTSPTDPATTQNEGPKIESVTAKVSGVVKVTAPNVTMVEVPLLDGNVGSAITSNEHIEAESSLRQVSPSGLTATLEIGYVYKKHTDYITKTEGPVKEDGSFDLEVKMYKERFIFSDDDDVNKIKLVLAIGGECVERLEKEIFVLNQSEESASIDNITSEDLTSTGLDLTAKYNCQKVIIGGSNPGGFNSADNIPPEIDGGLHLCVSLEKDSPSCINNHPEYFKITTADFREPYKIITGMQLIEGIFNLDSNGTYSPSELFFNFSGVGNIAGGNAPLNTTSFKITPERGEIIYIIFVSPEQ